MPSYRQWTSWPSQAHVVHLPTLSVLPEEKVNWEETECEGLELVIILFRVWIPDHPSDRVHNNGMDWIRKVFFPQTTPNHQSHQFSHPVVTTLTKNKIDFIQSLRKTFGKHLNYSVKMHGTWLVYDKMPLTCGSLPLSYSGVWDICANLHSLFTWLVPLTANGSQS